MLIDSHCHLSFKDLGAYKDTQMFINNAIESNIGLMLDIATSKSGFEQALQFSENRSNIVTAIGIHPLYILENSDFTNNDIIKYISNPKIVAIGETGLDYYRGKDEQKMQMQFFKIHCELACKFNLPIIIHTRMANKDTMDVLKHYFNEGGLKGVIHCFSGDLEFAKQVLNIGFNISFSGIVTFKNASEIQEVAKYVPDDSFILETDSPYLAPDPMRGKINQPAFIKYIYQYVASLRNTKYEELVTQIENNFFKLFTKAKVQNNESKN